MSKGLKLSPLNTVKIVNKTTNLINTARITDKAIRQPFPGGLMDKNMFSTIGLSGTLRNYSINNMRARIQLSVGVFNPIYTQMLRYLSYLICGKYSTQELKEIATLTGQCLLYSRKDNNYFTESKDRLEEYSEDIKSNNIVCYYGGQAIREIFQFVDREEALKKAILADIIEKYSKREYPNLEDTVVVNTTGEGYRIFEGYYLYLTTPVHNLVAEDLIGAVHEKIAKKDIRSVTAFLLAVDLEKFKEALVIDSIIVTPIGVRPATQHGNDPDTVMYSGIIKVAKELESGANSYSPTSRFEMIAKLYQHVSNFLLKSEEQKPSYRSRIEKLKNKSTGVIRGHMLGKRQDFTGRAPIVCNPKCSIKNASIPETMLERFRKFHTNFSDNANINREEFMTKVPVCLNRAPTLHRLSTQAYLPLGTTQKAIGIHPLVTTPYNADFDGDQMSAEAPTMSSSIEEVSTLMLAYNNRYYPASGEPVHMPKQDMIYGLHHMSKDTDNGGEVKVEVDDTTIYNTLTYRICQLYDRVSYNGKVTTLAQALCKYCVPNKHVAKVTREGRIILDKNNVAYLIRLLAEESHLNSEEYVTYLDRITQTSFRVATLYNPNISPFTTVDTGVINKEELFKDFDIAVNELNNLKEKGYISVRYYEQKYAELFSNLDDKVSVDLFESLGAIGQTEIVQSKSRGSTSTLKQSMFYKGQIDKPSGGIYPLVIKKSFRDQLTPSQHVIASLGARRGMVDKSIKPGETGEAMRNMKFTMTDMIIKTDDCGATRGFVINKHTMYPYMGYTDASTVESNKYYDLVKEFITGRYLVGGKFVDNELAISLATRATKEDINIEVRSPMYCKDSCCAKCFGVDLATRRKVVKGTSIGTISAQAIGEPGTQMTMQQFKKGGIAQKESEYAMTSDFSRIKTIIYTTGVREDTPNYDIVGWADGEVHEIISGNRKYISIGNHPAEVSAPLYMDFKKYAEKGKGLSKYLGMLDVSTLAEIKGIEEAMQYIALKIYFIYKNQTNVNIKHLEVLAASLAVFVITDTTEKDTFRVGECMTKVEYADKDIDSRVESGTVKGIWTIKSAKVIPLIRECFLTGLAFNNITQNLVYAVLLGKRDEGKYAISRTMMGLAPLQGTHFNKEFLTEYRRTVNSKILI